LQSKEGVLYEEEAIRRRGERRRGESVVDFRVVDDDKGCTLLEGLKGKFIAIEIRPMKRKEHATCRQIACVCTDEERLLILYQKIPIHIVNSSYAFGEKSYKIYIYAVSDVITTAPLVGASNTTNYAIAQS
jgi:hypothetical protein